MTFILASNNEGKLTEMRQILSALGVDILPQNEAGITLEPEETGDTFYENACIKAETISKASGMPAIADDSGLMVEALGGRPGVYSKRYGGISDDTERNSFSAEGTRKYGTSCRKIRQLYCMLFSERRHSVGGR